MSPLGKIGVCQYAVFRAVIKNFNAAFRILSPHKCEDSHVSTIVLSVSSHTRRYKYNEENHDRRPRPFFLDRFGCFRAGYRQQHDDEGQEAQEEQEEHGDHQHFRQGPVSSVELFRVSRTRLRDVNRLGPRLIFWRKEIFDMKAICTAALTLALLSGTVVFAQSSTTDTNSMAGSNTKAHKKHKKTKKSTTGTTSTSLR